MQKEVTSGNNQNAFLTPLSARIFTNFRLLEGRVLLHKGAWVATLLGTLLGVQDYKKVKFPRPL